ncbi:phospholipase D-like domain-containing protein [Rhabdothermincola salaria]|uniref:phospholipase D-like domain-containing protein n=1 Tax=Rhabdothermincola salaria TaxID=2903142 RepID=UPI001E2AC3CB|nr:phospholipase D-like domain-containing protein [Rhabdothermincola salaria]MCD9622515.1 phospholipase D-like domain-containing protein [Rhabdothermincola salaria]
MTRLSDVVTTALGTPPTDGNRIDLLRNGDEIFPSMLAAIDEAEESVDLLTFVYWTGDIARRMAAALSAAAHRGVAVRVLLDAIGASSMDEHLVDVMARAGADVRLFRPPLSRFRFRTIEHRTHRKVLVCDDKIGFTGGVGIAAEWEGDARGPDEWRDTHARVEGPAVASLRAAFIQNWSETEEVFLAEPSRPLPEPAGNVTVHVVHGQSSVVWSDVGYLFRVLVASAERRLRISTAYFSPDEEFLDLLVRAARRDVDIQILVPGPNIDKRVSLVASRSSYANLATSGVQIREFQPTMLHTKVITVDGETAVIGSANMNGRSMERDDEVSLVIHDAGLTARLDQDFDEDLERSEIVVAERWVDPPLHRVALDKVAAGVRRFL